ncbi:MAG: hypothetical protein UV87_C0004G0002 [candidate division WWE3 bacterium GW2011_GWD1_43_201]|nr:MAG: hypothetical protein UV87_C0004G0002 [candidate division WWE3 bacterium GW2011_GWD1_43_201]
MGDHLLRKAIPLALLAELIYLKAIPLASLAELIYLKAIPLASLSRDRTWDLFLIREAL